MRSQETYTVVVQVTDSEGDNGDFENPAVIDDTITVTITVNNVEEAGKVSLTWTRPQVGAEITASLTDPDDGDTLFYSLDVDSAAIFNIDSSNGQLKTKADLDQEAEETYTVTVSVRDSRNANGVGDMESDASINVTITVTITITDVNEPPDFPDTETGTRNVLENTATNQAIGNPLAAVDPDVGATLTYTLGGTDAASFGFDTSTGQLKTKADLDKEAKDTYTVTVSVHDSHPDNTVDDPITVTINVTTQTSRRRCRARTP